MTLKAIEIDGAWVIETPDGRRLDGKFGGVFHSRRVAEAVIDFLMRPKPPAEAVPQARIQPANAAENKILRQLKADRMRRTAEARVALIRQVASDHGLGWSEESGFYEIDPLPRSE